jgi:transposase
MSGGNQYGSRTFQEAGIRNLLWDIHLRPRGAGGHFLRTLDSIIDWDVFTNQLIEFYNGGAMYGRPPYDPAVLLKMLLISYLYELSERQAEQYVHDAIGVWIRELPYTPERVWHALQEV